MKCALFIFSFLLASCAEPPKRSAMNLRPATVCIFMTNETSPLCLQAGIDESLFKESLNFSPDVPR